MKPADIDHAGYLLRRLSYLQEVRRKVAEDRYGEVVLLRRVASDYEMTVYGLTAYGSCERGDPIHLRPAVVRAIAADLDAQIAEIRSELSRLGVEAPPDQQGDPF